MRIRTLVIPAGGFALPACRGRVARMRRASTSDRAGPRRAATGADSLSPARRRCRRGASRWASSTNRLKH